MASRRRNIRHFRQVQVKRAKSIHLGEQTVVLVVELRTTEEQTMEIFLCLYPIDNKKDLPENLRLTLLSESGELLEEIQVGSHKNYLEQPLDGVSGERFSVKVALDDSSVTENFSLISITDLGIERIGCERLRLVGYLSHNYLIKQGKFLTNQYQSVQYFNQ